MQGQLLEETEDRLEKNVAGVRVARRLSVLNQNGRRHCTRPASG